MQHGVLPDHRGFAVARARRPATCSRRAAASHVVGGGNALAEEPGGALAGPAAATVNIFMNLAAAIPREAEDLAPQPIREADVDTATKSPEAPRQLRTDRGVASSLGGAQHDLAVLYALGLENRAAKAASSDGLASRLARSTGGRCRWR